MSPRSPQADSRASVAVTARQLRTLPHRQIAGCSAVAEDVDGRGMEIMKGPLPSVILYYYENKFEFCIGQDKIVNHYFQSSIKMTAQTLPRPRGRPRAYDPEQALEQALQTFWKSGYCGTSLDDLSAAMHMNRPSLYAGFGDKRQLYVKAMQRFQAQARQRFVEALEPKADDASFADVITRYLHAAIDLYVARKHGAVSGCAVIATAAAQALVEPDIHRILEAVLQEMDGQLRACLQAAVDQGALAQETDVEALTFLLAASAHSIGIRARAGHTRARLARMVDALACILCPVGEETSAARAKTRGRRKG